MDPLALARAAAANVTARLASAHKFEANLPINDYGREVRALVMKGTTLAEIASSTNTSITQKGRFYPTGEEASWSEKLRLLVEGQTFGDVEMAMRKLGALLPGGGMAFSEIEGEEEKKILFEPKSWNVFRLVLPGYRCRKCRVEFWTVEDARGHFERDNAAGL
ncbi:uncharacterized protein RCC_08844 [Ramularia collo-cygni]|uniref:ATP-dependent RNA helicase PRP5/DDX46/KHDC4 KH domain-containing protein n=1 Tax=Ramularia collo-cygni TaxID=112498 RepID=A0A2D3VKZ8_9PEZI|nr:uncharacterized protein RCC_08844 [Ramularia collo-cygni]CZT23134.1 uncharacterized protein RCC_08844 [Ramularia collo-cygni]